VERIEEMGAAERGGDRQHEALGELLHRRAGGLRPAAAAKERDRPLRLVQQRLQPPYVGRAGRGLDRVEGGRVGSDDTLDQHVLRQGNHHRAWPPAGRHMERARDELGNARRVVDLGHPFGDRAEDGTVVELLERLALAILARYLADEQDQRRGILLCDVEA